MKIEKATRNIVKRLECDGKYKKTAEKIKKSYKQSFQSPMCTTLHKAENTKKQSIESALLELHDSVDNLFVNMDDKERFNSIGKPFLNTLKKAIINIKEGD